MRKIIAKIRTGSHLYGLNTINSDEDFFSIFIPNEKDLLGLKTLDYIDNSTNKSDAKNTNKDIDDKLYSLQKYLNLLIQNNPNIVETLFVNNENLIKNSFEFEELRANYDRFISRKAINTFYGYAVSQRSKLNIKSKRYKSLCVAEGYLQNLIDNDYNRKYEITDDIADVLNYTLEYYKGSKGNTEHFHKGMNIRVILEKISDEKNKYGWRVNNPSFNTLGYDIKFAYHLIRILVEGIEIIETERLTFPLIGEARNDIIRIRNEEVSLEELSDIYDKYQERFNEAERKTRLPEKPDWEWVNNFCIENTLFHLRG